MTDTIAFLNLCVQSSQELDRVYKSLRSISDRIAADSGLSQATADAAQNTGRKDLTTADFDNMKVACDLLTALLNASNGESVPISINTGGDVKLAFYRMI